MFVFEPSATPETAYEGVVSPILFEGMRQCFSLRLWELVEVVPLEHILRIWAEYLEFRGITLWIFSDAIIQHAIVVLILSIDGKIPIMVWDFFSIVYQMLCWSFSIFRDSSEGLLLLWSMSPCCCGTDWLSVWWLQTTVVVLFPREESMGVYLW